MKHIDQKERNFLITKLLLKYSDEDHPLTLKKLNILLSKYDMQCTMNPIERLQKALKKLGVYIKSKKDMRFRFWLENPFFTDENLNSLIFAVTTNPYISNQQTKGILNNIKPMVSVYKETLLEDFVDKKTYQSLYFNDDILDKFHIVQKAIAEKSRLSATIRYMKRIKDTNNYAFQEGDMLVLVPHKMILHNNEIYVYCYETQFNTYKTINLKDFVRLQPVAFNKIKNWEHVYTLLDSTDPYKYIPQKECLMLYKGPIRIKASHYNLNKIETLLGMPTEPYVQTSKGPYLYVNDDATITSDILLELMQLPGELTRIMDNPRLISAIENYLVYVKSYLTKNKYSNPDFKLSTKTLKELQIL